MEKKHRNLFRFIVCTLLFVSLFHTGLFLQLVLFYRGIVFLIIANIVYWIWTKSIPFSVVFFCVHMLFFTLVPVTLDRSISTFLLRYLATNPTQPVSETTLETVFISEYVQQKNAIHKRVKEQLQSGTISTSEKGFVLSNRGKVIVQLFSIIGRMFGLKS